MITRRFDGKVAVVTGASRGFGRSAAVLLANEGADFVVNYIREADARFPGAAEEALGLITAAGGPGELYEADVADTGAVRELLRSVHERRGKLDVLVNNAGICPMVELMEITEEIWDRVHDINLRAVFFATAGAARLMIESGTAGRCVCV